MKPTSQYKSLILSIIKIAQACFYDCIIISWTLTFLGHVSHWKWPKLFSKSIKKMAKISCCWVSNLYLYVTTHKTKRVLNIHLNPLVLNCAHWRNQEVTRQLFSMVLFNWVKFLAEMLKAWIMNSKTENSFMKIIEIQW